MQEILSQYALAMRESIDFIFVIKFVILYFFIIWIALVVWVVRDIRIRTNNLFFQLFCVFLMLVLTPFGVFIYLLIRPGKTLYERYYDEIEENLDIFHEIVEERRKLLEQQSAEKTQKIKKSSIDKEKLLAKQSEKITVKKKSIAPSEKKTKIKGKKF